MKYCLRGHYTGLLYRKIQYANYDKIQKFLRRTRTYIVEFLCEIGILRDYRENKLTNQRTKKQGRHENHTINYKQYDNYLGNMILTEINQEGLAVLIALSTPPNYLIRKQQTLEF